MRRLSIAVLLAALSIGSSHAKETIKIVVPFAAGGPVDAAARLLASEMQASLGANIVVENRGGAGGNLAAKSVAGATADGHTILATTTAVAVNDTASKNKGYDTMIRLWPLGTRK